MSLTGSFLVFYKTIDEWLNPALVTTSGEGSYRPLNDIVAVAQAAGPPDGALESLEWPLHRHGVFLAWYNVQTSVADEFRMIQVSIDPYTGTVRTKDREWGRYLVSLIYKLHASLLIGDVGRTILGFVAIALLASISTGLYLWWPRPSRIPQALTFTSTRSPIRRQYEWHKLSGFYSAILLGMLAFTGLYLEFSDYMVPIVRLFPRFQSTQRKDPCNLFRLQALRHYPLSRQSRLRDRYSRMGSCGTSDCRKEIMGSITLLCISRERFGHPVAKVRSGWINTAVRSFASRIGGSLPAVNGSWHGFSRFTTAKHSGWSAGGECSSPDLSHWCCTSPRSACGG